MEQQYLDLLKRTFAEGAIKSDRTGTGTRSHFGDTLRFNLSRGHIPLLSTKTVSLKNIIIELLWLISGDTNATTLSKQGCNIWNEWALRESDLEKLSKAPLSDHQRWAKYMDVFKETHTKEEHEAEIVRFEKTLSREEGLAIFDAADIPKFYTYGELGYKVGDLGPVYGKQWRAWGPNKIDQLAEAIKLLKTKPDSRRIIVNSWNVDDLPDESISPQDNVLNGKMALAPCHAFFQFWTRELNVFERIYLLSVKDKALEKEYYRIMTSGMVEVGVEFDPTQHVIVTRAGAETVQTKASVDAMAVFLDEHTPKRSLSCQLYQRSTDEFLGLPYNIVSYSVLTMMMAHECGMAVDEFIWAGGDNHVYSNHTNQIIEQLSRIPEPEAPTLKLNPNVPDIFSFTLDDFELINYKPQGIISAPVAV